MNRIVTFKVKNKIFKGEVERETKFNVVVKPFGAHIPFRGNATITLDKAMVRDYERSTHTSI
jgi:hypothetical protein